MNGAAPSVEATSWTVRRLFADAGLARFLPDQGADIPITILTDDSRKVAPGACFVAVRGERSDGHAYLSQAIGSDAACLVIDRLVEVPPDVVAVRVPDSRIALAKLAAAYYRLRPGQRSVRLGLAGITGTNGKSTTCELLRGILQAAGEPAALLGTIRYDLLAKTFPASLTTPPPLELCAHLAAAADAGARWAVMETSSHALDQHRCDGLEFSAGVFTNLSGDHLDYHGTTESYLRAKKRLFDGLRPDAVAIINAADPRSAEMVANCRARLIRFGLDGDCDLTAVIHELSASGSRFTIIGDGRSLPIRSALVGMHNVMNVLAAAATARSLGFDDEALREGIESVRSVRGRLESVTVPGQDFAVLVDYAHTDDALDRVLSSLRPLTAGKLTCVFGCGGDRDRTKRPRMAAAAARHAHLAVVTSDNPRTEDPQRIIEDIMTGFTSADGCEVRVQPDRAEAVAIAVAEASAGDTVVIAGKGHEDYQILGTQRRHFDDVEAARRCLLERMERRT